MIRVRSTWRAVCSVLAMMLNRLPQLIAISLLTLSVACGSPPQLIDSAQITRIGDGGEAVEEVHAAAIADDGSLIVFGTMTNTWDGTLLGQRYQSPAGGFYLAKLNPAGDVAWVRTMEADLDVSATRFDVFGTGLVLDEGGNIIITGYTRRDIDLGDGIPTVPSWTDEDTATFVAKYSPGGDILWSRLYWGSDRYGWPGPPQLDADGNILFLDYDQWGVDFGDGKRDSYDTVLVKVAPNGDLVYARGFGDSNLGLPLFAILSFALEPSGEAVLSGMEHGVIELDNQYRLGTDDTWGEVFFRVDPAGRLVSARDYPGETELGRAAHMSRTADGDFIAVGYDAGESGYALAGGFIERLAPDGTRRWRTSIELTSWVSLGGSLLGFPLWYVASDDQGRPVVVNGPSVSKYDLDGDRLWQYDFTSAPRLRRVGVFGSEVLVFGAAGHRFELGGQVVELAGDEYIRDDGYVIRFSAGPENGE